MDRRTVPLLLFLAFTGCATLNAPNDFRQIGTHGFLGITPQSEENGIRVRALRPNTPASRSDLQVNDLLVSFEGHAIHNKEDRKAMWQLIHDSPGKRLSFGVMRSGAAKSVAVVLGSMPLYAENQVYDKINVLLIDEEKQVAVATVVENVANPLPLSGTETLASRRQWSDSIRSSLLSTTENRLISTFGLLGTFRVVDRLVLEKVMGEQKLQIAGATDNSAARQLGQLAGATHVIIIDFARGPETPSTYSDTTTMRLLDVETGAILASSSYHQVRSS